MNRRTGSSSSTADPSFSLLYAASSPLLLPSATVAGHRPATAKSRGRLMGMDVRATQAATAGLPCVTADQARAESHPSWLLLAKVEPGWPHLLPPVSPSPP
jgi:hypothetical protein